MLLSAKMLLNLAQNIILMTGQSILFDFLGFEKFLFTGFNFLDSENKPETPEMPILNMMLRKKYIKIVVQVIHVEN